MDCFDTNMDISVCSNWSGFLAWCYILSCGRIVQPTCYVVDNPVETLHEVLASHRAARKDLPPVRFDRE